MVGPPRLHHFLTTLDLLGFTSEAQTYLYQNPFPFPRDACRIHNRLGLSLCESKNKCLRTPNWEALYYFW